MNFTIETSLTTGASRVIVDHVSDEDKMDWAEDFTGPDFCHVCNRATEHYGEHSDAQLISFYNDRGAMFR